MTISRTALDPRGVRPGFNLPGVCRLELQDHKDFPLSSESGEGMFKKSIEFINNLGHDVYLGERSGMKMIIKPKPLPLKDASGRQLPPGLYVMVVYQYNPDMCIFSLPDTTLMEGNMRINRSWNSDKVRTESVGGYALNGKNLTRRIFIYIIEPHDLHRYPTMYLDDIDCVVSVENPHTWTHPYSPDGFYARGIAEGTLENITNPNIFSFNVEIVAEEGSLSNKYVNIGNNIYQVKINNQVIREQGVYITYNKRIRSDGFPGLDNQDYFPLSELNKGVYGNKEKSKLPILFYNTAEDAMIHGDVDRARDIELKELKKQIEDQKIQMDREKLEMERLKLDRDRVERELDIQERVYKQRNELNKLERQESIEVIKYIPAVLGVIMSVMAFYTKMSK